MMHLQLIIISAYFFVYVNSSSLSYNIQSPIVLTKNGEIKGQLRESRDGRAFYAFTGIPYARPPVGDLRFAEPQSPDPWNYTYDATKESPVCIQRNYLFSSNPPIEGQEDCLYLNVFVPKIGTYNNRVSQLLPVMIFIHWGGFIAGRSTTGYLGPNYFMDKNVLLVTFNYRIGPFGFLSTTDDEAPGNYGLKDQVAVLKWVQAEIESFGGNKNNVTIFGQSAGAGSVHYHILSPSSKGLYHKAISQSGSALAGWAQPLNVVQKQVSIAQAKFVGCGNSSAVSKELVDCLRSVPAKLLMTSQDYFRRFYGNPLMLFGPVMETKSSRNKNPFLTKTPLQYILSGEISNVPWLTGVVKNEGDLKAASLIRPRQIREELNQDFENLLSNILLIFSLSTDNPHSLYTNVTKFYLNSKERIELDDPKTIQGLIDVFSDRSFLYPLYQSILLHSYKNHSPIYLYSFEYEGKLTYGDLFSQTTENINYDWGTCHCDDLLYLFNSPDLLEEPTGYNDLLLSNVMITLWTNFAKYGVPEPTFSFLNKEFTWSPLHFNSPYHDDSNGKIELLNISGNSLTGPKFEMSKGFYAERMKFWADSDIFENAYSF